MWFVHPSLLFCYVIEKKFMELNFDKHNLRLLEKIRYAILRESKTKCRTLLIQISICTELYSCHTTAQFIFRGSVRDRLVKDLSELRSIEIGSQSCNIQLEFVLFQLKLF